MPFVHPLAYVSGDVSLGPRVFVLPFASIRGDTEAIRIGEETNVQDGAVIHADPGLPCIIGKRVTIGHRAIVHGARVGDDALIGMGAIVLNGAVIGEGALVAAGAVVPERMVIPPGVLVAGIPARTVRELSREDRERIASGVASYVALAVRHRAGDFESRFDFRIPDAPEAR